ncbi:protein kinase [Candidatus Saganbacteria bacterium]|nr:protein kinase [Candidatus Saganbacteria bacterium]
MDKFLKSRFKTGKKLSENPYSLTYNGTTLSGEQPVIIKIYKRGTLNSSLIKTMKQKVKLLQEFSGARIVPLLDGDYGWQGFYFVRPYIKAQNLEEYSKTNRLEISDIEKILLEICEGLFASHSKGIVHGALKATNIFINKDGVKLADFVIEGEVKEAIPQKAAAILLNDDNLSPEELAGGRATTLSDIFSLGVILYKLLGGKSPYANPVDRFYSRYKRIDSAPRHLQEIMAKCLQVDPLLRFKNINELGESIKHKSIIEDHGAFDFPLIELENTPHPKEKEVQIIKEERKRSFFLLIVIILSAAAGIIYGIINSILMR